VGWNFGLWFLGFGLCWCLRFAPFWSLVLIVQRAKIKTKDQIKVQITTSPCCVLFPRPLYRFQQTNSLQNLSIRRIKIGTPVDKPFVATSLSQKNGLADSLTFNQGEKNNGR
jgi:hypothetical protein